MTTRVALVGGTGKLGAIIAGVIDELDDFETVAVLGSASDLAEIDAADLVVDASTPGVSIDVVRAAIERGKNVLVGTSGWSTERIALVRPLVEAAGTGAVFIPNFSLGSVVATALAAAAAPLFPSIEIVETHRETKSTRRVARRCAPPNSSPTLASGRPGRIAACRSARARQQVASVPIHSLRRPGVIAKQETILSGPGKSLTIVHDTIEPARAYAPGIRVALAAARDARG
jgi:4-hydroxy-tetrahydrodipicolinate reductase